MLIALSVSQHVMGFRSKFISVSGTTEKSTPMTQNKNVALLIAIYRVIHKSLRDFRPLRYSSRDGHAEWEQIQQRERHSKFLSYLTGARYVDF